MNETKTKATHTPGPWSRVYEERFRHDNSAGVRAANGLYIAAALDRNRYDLDEEVEANARLIAAAPELAAACKTALVWFAWYDASPPDALPTSDVPAAQLRAALAKACGE